MKFIINRELLLAALVNVSRGLSDKKPMPVLTGIKLKLTDEQLILTTTNKEVSIQIVINKEENLQILEVGSCVVPGKYFLEIIKKLDGEIVEFTLFEERTVKIISDRSDFTLIAHDESLFPNINFSQRNEPITFESKIFKQIIKQTSFAAATSESRIVLTSVNFKFENNELQIIATDSFRLARKILSFNQTIPNGQINIPSKSLEELGKILDENNETLSLFIIDKTALFIYKNVSFLTRLVEGIYPDTASLFPKNHILQIKFNKNEIISAVDRAALFTSSENLSVVKMTLTKQDTVEISSNSTEIGKVVEEVYPVELQTNNGFQIAFSTKYLLDALKSFDSKEIKINFTGEIKPAIIYGDNDNDLVQLLLPVRVF